MSQSTLRDAVKTAQEKKGNSSSSDKNPAWYNRQKNRFATAMVMNENPIVRAAAAIDSNCSTKHLREALKIEQEPTVLKALLMNDNLPVKDIVTFVEDERAEQFSGDEELTAFLVARIN